MFRRPDPNSVDHIRAIPLFDGLRPRELRTIASHSMPMTVAAGRELGREGDLVGQFVVVVTGHVDVAPEGLGADRRGPGEFVGEELARGVPRWSHDVVVGERSDLLVMSAPELRGVVADVPVIGRRLCGHEGDRPEIRRGASSLPAMPFRPANATTSPTS